MSPPMCPPTRRRICFPRVSGDEPVGLMVSVMMISFSPRERG